MLNIPWDPSRTAIVSDEESIPYAYFQEALISGKKGFALGDLRAGVAYPMQLDRAAGDVMLLLSVMARGAVAAPLSARWPFEEIHRVSERLATIPARSISASIPSGPWGGLEEDWRLIVHTSGSSGEAKAAMLSAANCAASADAAVRHLNLEAGDRWLLSLPLNHVGGLGIVFRCLSAGATIAAPEPSEALEEALIRYGPSHVSLVATQLYRLLRELESAKALARCKAVLLGGGPVPEGLVREALERGIRIYTSYGMTETASMITCTEPGDSADHLLTSGKPLVEGTVSISGEGEILVRGETLFQGYVQSDGRLELPLTDAGWFATGDLGYFDGEGYLHVTGRRDNMFISGGENIQPEEIEAHLVGIDGVAEAVVVPVADPEWGQRPVAFVRMADGRALEAVSMLGALRETLPGYKVPKTVLAWPDDLERGGIKPSRADFQRKADAETLG